MPMPKADKDQLGRGNAAVSDLFAPVAGQLKQVRGRMVELLATRFVGINQQIESIGAGEGKLFRPAVLLLSAQLTGTLRDEHIELAMMVELIHTATLLHDDVIDQAKTRRSRQTVNSLWGNKAAILLGDFLLSRAFLAGARINLPDAGRILCSTAEKICQGELLQNMRQGDWTLNEEDYLEIIEAKTASLFAASCRLGALASGASDAVQQAVETYGRQVGMIFQITDDILDIAGDDQKVGKTLGTDFMQQKLTLPVIHYLHSRKTQNPEELIQRLTGFNAQQLKAALTESGSLDYARAFAHSCADKANQAISSLPDGLAKKTMQDIIAAITARA